MVRPTTERVTGRVNPTRKIGETREAVQLTIQQPTPAQLHTPTLNMQGTSEREVVARKA